MKNILILDTGKEWGGGTNSLLELLRRIDKTNYRFTALFYRNYSKPGESDIKTEIKKLGVDFSLLDRNNPPVMEKILKELGRGLLFFNRKLRKLYIFWIDYFFRIKKDAKNIARLIQKLNIDLIYMNNQPSSNLEGIIAAKNSGIPSLLHSRIETDLNFFEISTVNKFLTKAICVSGGVKDSLVRQGIKESKCTVIHNGIDASILPSVNRESIRRELGVNENELLIGSAGSLVKRKCFDDLIRAMASLRTQNTEHRIQTTDNPPIPPLINGGEGGFLNKIKCIIAGEGLERESLQGEIDKNKLNGRAILTGFKSNAISYINAMDIFILPSEREGFPRVILEAMLMEKPVIASRIAGPAELVINGQTGFLFQAGNIEELAGHISLLLSSSLLRKEMGEAGRRRVIENFSIERYVNQVSGIFAEAAG
jgi:glycosyltransferase involved in cell wall biosynthesis